MGNKMRKWVNILLVFVNMLFALYLVMPLFVNFFSDTSIVTTFFDFIGFMIAMVFISQCIGLLNIYHRHPKYFKYLDFIGIILLVVYIATILWLYGQNIWILCLGMGLLIIDHIWNINLMRRMKLC